MAAHLGQKRAQERIEREKTFAIAAETKKGIVTNLKNWMSGGDKGSSGKQSDHAKYKSGRKDEPRASTIKFGGPHRVKYTDAELEAAVKLGRFATVRRRLKDISRQRKKVQHYIRAICLHVLFTFIFVYNIWVSDEERYYSVNALREMFVYEEFGDFSVLSYPDIVTVAEMYDWMDSVLVGNFYGAATFDDAHSNVVRLDGLTTDRWMLGGVFRKIGGVRIGTIRANKRGCGTNTNLFVKNDTAKMGCFEKGPYSLRNSKDWENKSDFGNFDEPFTWGGWNATDTSARRAETFTEQSTYKGDQHYNSPAYSFVLPQTDAVEGARLIRWARDNQFVDYSTRAVIADMSVLNGATNQVITMRFVFSFAGWGGIVPFHEFTSVDTDPIPILTIDFANLAISDMLVIFEVIFYAYFVLEHLYRMVFDWCHHNEEYDSQACCHYVQLPVNYIQHIWADPPEMWQLVNMFFYGVAWSMKLLALHFRPTGLVMEQDGYVPLRSFTELTTYTRYALFPTTVAIFFRLLFFMAIIPHFGVITSALSRSIAALLGWLFVYAVQAGMWVIISISLYGTKLESFRSTQHALMTIIQMSVLGENIIPDILEVDGTSFSIAFIILFYLLNTLMLLNMMIAIISDAYVDAKEAMESGDHPDVRIGREVHRYFMLKIWKIPLLGRWLKHRYINYGRAQRNAIHRKITADMTLHQQLKTVAAKDRAIQKKRAKSSLNPTGGLGGKNQSRRSSTSSKMPNFGGSARNHSKYAVAEGEPGVDHMLYHDQRITKTAAQQTLKELRGVARRLDELSELVHSNLASGGGMGDPHFRSVDEFLFHQRTQKKGDLFGPKSGPHFILDGQPGQDHSVVEMTEFGRKKGGTSGSKDQYGVL